MPSLPTRSTGNSLNGLWFVFQDGQNKLHAWGSAATGKEKVYLNYQLVSERRNLKKQSAHLFQEKGTVYEIKFNTTSILKGHLECRLFKNGILVQAIACKYVKQLGIPWKRFLLLAVIGILVGPITVFFNLSRNQLIGGFLVFAFCLFISKLAKKYTFEDITHA